MCSIFYNYLNIFLNIIYLETLTLCELDNIQLPGHSNGVERVFEFLNEIPCIFINFWTSETILDQIVAHLTKINELLSCISFSNNLIVDVVFNPITKHLVLLVSPKSLPLEIGWHLKKKS